MTKTNHFATLKKNIFVGKITLFSPTNVACKEEISIYETKKKIFLQGGWKIPIPNKAKAHNFELNR